MPVLLVTLSTDGAISATGWQKNGGDMKIAQLSGIVVIGFVLLVGIPTVAQDEA